MDRLPFDPDKVDKPDAGTPARRERKRYGEMPGERPMSVTQVTDLLKRVLADRTPSPLKVVGEVSNFSDRNHWYLSLKDEQNVLSCAMWQSAAKKCGFTPQRGQQVVATGKLDYYGPQGRLQMYIDKLEPVGQGALELRFRELCDELRQAGYFADEHKRPMPAFVTHIAVVTSANGAALQDVIRTARQRWAGVKLSVIDVKVQGAAAAGEVAAAINALSKQHAELGVDAVIVTRGGGSLEDLWAFNERVVADAVYHCDVYIAAAIGHETDTSIAELVADLRCSTPTQAAMRLVPDAAAELQHVDQLAGRLTTALRRRAERAAARLDSLARHELFRRPGELIQRRRESLEHDAHRLRTAMRDRLADLRAQLAECHHTLTQRDPKARAAVARTRLDALAQRLDAIAREQFAARRRHVDALERQLTSVGPASVLKRGYTYTTDADGQLLRSAAAIKPGDAITTHLADGRVDSQVTDTHRSEKADAARDTSTTSGSKQRKGKPRQTPPDDKPAAPDKPATKRKTKKRGDSDTPSLFDQI